MQGAENLGVKAEKMVLPDKQYRIGGKTRVLVVSRDPRVHDRDSKQFRGTTLLSG
jgi:hypothetical protein